MKKNILFLFVIILIASCRNVSTENTAPLPASKDTIIAVNSGNIDFAKYFIDKTMRLDYFHSGTATEEHFAKEVHRNKVGAFEGAGYVSKGLYRSQIVCIMYTRHLVFCKVCSRTIEDVIGQYIK
ncbi:MAG: hypothetical protein A2X05_06415 [Bacteroidetes bacterium GWE2_41_25]|nr:MAG: hypothetical protein A2X03_11925 [Bacteroidetes bacterium GWA2_40_15]OFX83913.1 MAG: hypothetical protein A2X06_14295 [Bacteroidetes bacterium GWC2_40_22]OFX99046.1 MAG: hypothetical protein A2X05_06415 [Bacteroidetes bacterium GWE2_41_25]OFY60374.1 MAG: hypothetical protein A2X04_17380 [Bacteroidetes bacterium GWF2_41_9]HAM10909.1 hypothetical protein [Bacteroidales bacterium]